MVPPPHSHPNYPVFGTSLIAKVTAKLLHHLNLGQMAGPYKLSKLPKFPYRIHTSPISAKLKSSGKAMMLVDASAPLGASINSAIKDEDKFVIYTSFFQLCYLLKKIGNRGWIWVVDAVDAYYRIPINKKYYHLFGIIWLNRLLIYKCLSFGLSTAPSIYNKFADLILWACTYWNERAFKHDNFFYIMHYLDDFFGGSKYKNIALTQMNFLIKLFELLNIPTNPSKVVGPSQAADILGWACRTIPYVQIGLAEKKRIKYLIFFTNINNNLLITFIILEKLIGYSRHSCNIYIEGNKFVRGFEKQKFAIQKKIEDKNSNITKNTSFKLSNEGIFDLKIWLQLLDLQKNKFVNVDYILQPNSLPSLNIYTDASTSFGAGGLTTDHQLYHLPWAMLPPKCLLFTKAFNIDIQEQIIYLELLALVLHAFLFAKKWSNKMIHFWCDNTTVVKIVKKGSIDFKSLLYYPKANLVKTLARLALKYDFHFTCHHIEGKKNIYADALSRENSFKRIQVYNKFNQKPNIPVKLAYKLINCTCVDKFSSALKI